MTSSGCCPTWRRLRKRRNRSARPSRRRWRVSSGIHCARRWRPVTTALPTQPNSSASLGRRSTRNSPAWVGCLEIRTDVSNPRRWIPALKRGSLRRFQDIICLEFETKRHGCASSRSADARLSLNNKHIASMARLLRSGCLRRISPRSQSELARVPPHHRFWLTRRITQ